MFIELTTLQDEKKLVNINYIDLIFTAKRDDITFTQLYLAYEDNLCLDVKESYEYIKKLLRECKVLSPSVSIVLE